MNTYSSDHLSSKKLSTAFKHVGALPSAGAYRIEGMFSHQRKCIFTESSKVKLLNINNNTIAERTLDEYILEFCQFAEQYAINEYQLNVTNPLRLIDLWEDDPIGSAGPGVIDPSVLSSTEKKK